MRKKFLDFFFFFIFCLLISSAFMTNEVFAGENIAQDPSSATGSCKPTGCWPHLGASEVVQALRFTVYDGKTRQKVSNSVDLINNKTHYNKINGKNTYILGGDGKPSYLNGKSLSVYNGEVNLQLSYFPDWYGKNIGSIKSWWNNLSVAAKKEILGWAGYTRYSTQDVLVVEPVTFLQWGGKGYWGSAYEFVKYMYDKAKCTDSVTGGCRNAVGVARRIMAAAVHLSTNDPIDPYGFITDINGNGILWRLDSSYVEIGKYKNNAGETYEAFKNVTNATAAQYIKGKYGYGIGVFWLKDSGLTNSCDVNVNNNSDSKYNWTKWNKNCDLDGDGTADGCWEKIDGGCCDQMTLTDTILNTYPQCAKCEVNNTSYIAGDTKESLDSITCDEKDKDITNYRGTGDFNTSTNKYCLANNKLYTGKINGKYYGCEIRDTLTLPRKYGSDLKIGQYFVWPTSKTLQSLGVFNNNYPVRRTSILNCVAYKYRAGGQLQYQTLTTNELNKIKDKYSQTGNLTLKFESNDNGAITIENTNASATNNPTDNDLFEVKVESTYTLNKINGTNGIYAYYDRNKEAYTNKIVTSKLSKYVTYGYPIIPYGDYVDGEDVERFDNKISIDYGINFDSMGFSRAKAFSGSYICTKDDVGNPMDCKCPVGTSRAGMSLIGYFSKGYTDFNAECAVAQNNHCAEGPIVCPDGTDITSCVSNKTYGGTDETEARNLCTAELCGNIDSPIGSGLDIIYRTIFLDDPFPSIKGSVRVPGANWGGSKSLTINKKYTGLVEEYITSTADKMYQGKPMYSITLTPKAIREIKNYNKSHGYDDFELTCGKNQYCTSDALHNTFSEYLTGGTCQLATNAKIRGRNDCRLKALNE